MRLYLDPGASRDEGGGVYFVCSVEMVGKVDDGDADGAVFEVTFVLFGSGLMSKEKKGGRCRVCKRNRACGCW